MKQLFTTLFLCTISVILGQTADDYLKSGVEKHTAKDYEGAIKEYNKAIKLDRNLTEAYYNRGNCKIGMKEFAAAKKDYDKTIELDPKFTKAYYGRASVFVSQERYEDALPDLDKTIELDNTFPNSLTLRGQIRAQTGNKIGACEDFKAAKENGDPQASKYLSQFCDNEVQDGESLLLKWPANENWKIGSEQENDEMTMVELIHSNETFENWTEIGTMIAIKGAKNIPMDTAMDLMFQQSKQNSPKAKLTFIEKDESARFPWIIFTIESPNFKNDKKAESQLWYIVQGKTSLYTNFRAIKESGIPNDLKEKWIQFFKTAKIVYN